MHETYCGKSCASCEFKSQLECPGCRMGPGQAYRGDCSISRCSLQRGYHTCEMCPTNKSCRNRMGSQSAPEYRLKKLHAEQEHKQKLVSNAGLLGKWMMVLFWLTITSNIVGVIFNDSCLGQSGFLKIFAAILNAAFPMAYAAVLLKLSEASSRYRIAGICGLISAGIGLVSALVGDEILATIVSLVAVIPSFIYDYQEMMGHADSVEEIDRDMARKWIKLWYWQLGSLVTMVLALLMMMVVPLLGALLTIASAIAVLVVAIIKLIYLYSCAKMFREYTAANLYRTL